MNYSTGLIPCINKPTRVTTSSATLIDNIFISQSLEGHYSSYVLTDDLSDHYPSVTTISDINQSKINKTHTGRNLNKKAVESILDDLKCTDWHEKLQHLSTENSFQVFHSIITQSIDLHAPVKEISTNSRRNHLPWITKGIKNSINKQKKMYKNSLKTKDSADLLLYKHYQNSLNRIKRASKLLHYQNECNKHRTNTKRLWQIINKLSGKLSNKSNLIECLTVDGLKQTEGKLICDEFAKHFSSVGKRYAENISSPKESENFYLRKITDSTKSIYFYPTTEHEIELLINKLPCKTSTGHDDISNNLLKQLKGGLLMPLEMIFNKSLTEGIFPSEMKKADVIPLHKGKRVDFVTNYRPISLLLTISKLLEKLVYRRTYNFLNDHGLLYRSQYGFRSKHSCENAIEELTK